MLLNGDVDYLKFMNSTVWLHSVAAINCMSAFEMMFVFAETQLLNIQFN